jgi:hypothetical protein
LDVNLFEQPTTPFNVTPSSQLAWNQQLALEAHSRYLVSLSFIIFIIYLFIYLFVYYLFVAISLRFLVIAHFQGLGDWIG